MSGFSRVSIGFPGSVSFRMSQVLQTIRLTLVPFDEDDAGLLYGMFTDPFIRAFLWDDVIIQREKATEILKISQGHFRDWGWGLWKVFLKGTNTTIGFAGLWLFAGEEQPQLLYGLFREFTGNGYATEAAKAVVDYAFSVLKFPHIVASCDLPNARSHAVCLRIGMRRCRQKTVNEKPVVYFELKAK